MSWAFLSRPSDDPNAVGLLSLRLETTWFSTVGGGDDDGDGENAGQGRDGVIAGLEFASCSPSSDGRGSGRGLSSGWDEAVGERQGPLQWNEEKAVSFIQVRVNTSDSMHQLFFVVFNGFDRPKGSMLGQDAMQRAHPSIAVGRIIAGFLLYHIKSCV